jgi:hypothetical protein
LTGATYATLQISVSDALKSFLECEANKKGFDSPNDYVQALLAGLQQRAAEKKEIETLLLEGVRSPTVLADKAFWEERRRKVLDRNPRPAPVFGTLRGTILHMAPDFDAIPEGFEE